MTNPDARGWHSSLRRHDVVVFMLVALILTWLVWVPRAMGTQVGVLGQLWTWMPAVAALVCAAVLYGRLGVRDLGRRLLLWRVRWWWYPVVLLGPLVFALMVAGMGGVARRAVGCRATARDDPVDSCVCVDVSDSGAHRRTRRRAGLAWVPPPTPPQLNRSPLRAAAVSCLSRLNHSYRVGSGEDGESG
jgi:hypothetical protein